MRTILVIGIGAGDPDHLTLQAVKAIGTVDVFFVLDKGDATQELVDLRHAILERHARPGAYRVVVGRDPQRDRGGAPYTSAVAGWRRRRADVCERMIRDELADGQRGAFLVWGDPTLYDSTLGILDDIIDRGAVALCYEVVPGISSVSALAARHGTALNQVGHPLQVTTGRRLREGLSEGTADVVVMLDAHGRFADLAADGLDIYWGAYLGMPDELLVSGPLGEVASEIVATREAARRRKGWIMDTYLLRRGGG